MLRLCEVLFEILYCATCGRRTEWQRRPSGTWYCTACEGGSGGDR